MIQNLFLRLRLNGAMSGNQFVYFLQRIPFLGKLFGDEWYKIGPIKTVISIVGSVFHLIYKLFTCSLYIACFALLPCLFIQGRLFYSENLRVFICMLFISSGIIGSVRTSSTLTFDLNKFYLLRIMRMPVSNYAKSNLLLYYVYPLFYYGDMYCYRRSFVQCIPIKKRCAVHRYFSHKPGWRDFANYPIPQTRLFSRRTPMAFYHSGTVTFGNCPFAFAKWIW